MGAGGKKNKISNLNSAMAMLGITLVIGLVAVNIYTDEKDMRTQEKSYIEREAALEREIESEEQRTNILNERKKYVATNQYIEEVAREKLGLIRPDEVLVKARGE
jgi:cell division protein DivIC